MSKFKDVIKGKKNNNNATHTDKAGNITEFGVTNADLLYSGSTLSDATKAALFKYFRDMYINYTDQEDVCVNFVGGIPTEWFSDADYGHFINDFNQKLLEIEDQYQRLLEIQMTEIDPLVADYFEDWRKLRTNHTDSDTSSGSNTPAGIAKSTTQTNDLTDNSQYSDSSDITKGTGNTITNTKDGYISETDIHGHTISTNSRDHSLQDANDIHMWNGDTVTTTDKTAAMTKALPNAISYGSASAGNLPDLDWRTGSGQNQTETENSVNHTGGYADTHNHDDEVVGSETHGGTDTHETRYHDYVDTTRNTSSGTDSKSGYGSNTTTKTGTVTTAETLTQLSGSNTSQNSHTEDHTDIEKHIHTGRSNELPQQALLKAIHYVEKSNAFKWLRNELMACFIDIY